MVWVKRSSSDTFTIGLQILDSEDFWSIGKPRSEFASSGKLDSRLTDAVELKLGLE